MKLGLVFNKNNKEIFEDILNISKIIKPFNAKLLISDTSILLKGVICCGSCDEVIKESDAVIAFGGDGTIIKTAKLCAKYGKAVIGVNKGNLGFLASLEINEIHKIKNIFTNDFKIKKSSVFQCQVDNKSFLFLNDIIVTRDTKSRIVDYQICKSNQSNICKYNADGIIISTSVGSTAYFLSAGGPIIDPQLDCLAIAPICPHTLCARSYVVDSSEPIVLKYTLKENSKICVFVDGNLLFSGLKSSEIIIKNSKLEAKFIVPTNYDFYKNVKKKLIKGAFQ